MTANSKPASAQSKNSGTVANSPVISDFDIWAGAVKRQMLDALRKRNAR